VMLAVIRDLWHQKGDLYVAIFEGAISLLRPILLTSLVSSLCFIPMALTTGFGEAVHRPLATVDIGGIVSSTNLT
ncbi:efflux RND transporter permease subunit, partial [Pseudoalteromonas sp. S1608]|uniref:efflux RND transporter permease subunit n=1 Tax=Pseudoalteromonas sp. S1608 TaxID=579504 RepID=UPI00110B26E2